MNPPTAQLYERSFTYGQQRWTVDSSGQWSVYVWGWWPFGANPRGQFMLRSRRRG